MLGSAEDSDHRDLSCDSCGLFCTLIALLDFVLAMLKPGRSFGLYRDEPQPL